MPFSGWAVVRGNELAIHADAGDWRLVWATTVLAALLLGVLLVAAGPGGRWAFVLVAAAVCALGMLTSEAFVNVGLAPIPDLVRVGSWSAGAWGAIGLVLGAQLVSARRVKRHTTSSP